MNGVEDNMIWICCLHLALCALNIPGFFQIEDQGCTWKHVFVNYIYAVKIIWKHFVLVGHLHEGDDSMLICNNTSHMDTVVRAQIYTSIPICCSRLDISSSNILIHGAPDHPVVMGICWNRKCAFCSKLHTDEFSTLNVGTLLPVTVSY